MQSLPSVAVILLLSSTSIQIDGQHIPISTCGRSLTAFYKPLIVNSLPTNHWPWHAAVYHLGGNNAPSYQCGGTVISSNTVLTAGHCVSLYNAPLDITKVFIALGRLNLAVNESTAQYLSVAKINLHPNFTSIDLSNDIATVQLSTKVKFNNFVQPVCLWPANRLELSDVIGKEGTVVGWGRTETGEASNVLRGALLPVVDSLICLATNRLVFGTFLSATNFCAGLRNGTGICDGDSGGSMTFEENGQYYIRGIVSLTVTKRNEGSQEVECDASHYAIFTDVAQYLPWITGMKNECVMELQCSNYSNRVYSVTYTSYIRSYLSCHVRIGPSEQTCKFFFAKTLNANVDWLQFSTKSDYLPDVSDAINKFVNLKVLNFLPSQVKLIERSKLAAFKRIEILILRDNEISQLSAETFIDLKNLIVLDLSSNKLQEVHLDLLSELTILKDIYLDKNHIQILLEELFRNNQKLERISMGSNKIKIVPPGLLKNQPHLKELFLFRNEIEILPEDFFRNNKELLRIYMDDNKLKELHRDLLKELVNLSWFFFSNNQLEVLPEGLFRNNQKLFYIELQNNKLKKIESKFQHLSILQSLNLESNICFDEQCFDGTFCGTRSLIEMQHKIWRNCSNEK